MEYTDWQQEEGIIVTDRIELRMSEGLAVQYLVNIFP